MDLSLGFSTDLLFDPEQDTLSGYLSSQYCQVFFLNGKKAINRKKKFKRSIIHYFKNDFIKRKCV